MRRLLDLRFTRNDAELVRGSFRPRGENLEIMPSGEEVIYKIFFLYDKIESLEIIHHVNRNVLERPDRIDIFPAKHYLVPESIQKKAVAQIRADLQKSIEAFEHQGKIVEAERISRKTNYDLEMIEEVGYCNGIENYSSYFDNRQSGEPPFSLLDYFSSRWGDDYLMVIDESHVTVPQIGGMYAGDKSRKDSLVEFGFRLPSARDNRPLKFDEFEKKMPKTIYVSATPGKYELAKTKGKIVEQIVRPTGLIDPSVTIAKTEGQIDNLLGEIQKNVKNKERVLVTTLTKKMAEDLTGYLKERGVKVQYLHSEVETLDRIEIIMQLRKGDFDVLIGVNLLREGLDMPEVSLVAILDADKEGFLRSETSLIQTIGRSARNVNGRVILYADNITQSMKRAIEETNRRRTIQLKYNEKHNISPATIKKEIRSILSDLRLSKIDEVEKAMSENDLQTLIKEKEAQMKEAADLLLFEEAVILRDQLVGLKKASKFFKKVR
jgi:excinuclease ABC subunit B